MEPRSMTPINPPSDSLSTPGPPPRVEDEDELHPINPIPLRVPDFTPTSVEGGILPLLTNRMRAFREQMNFQELSGSVGDLGTFLPLLLAMSKTGSVSLQAGLFFAGLVNVVTAFLWNIPMAVQPMKSIAAIAISQKLTTVQVSMAGMWVGFLVLILGVTGLMPILARCCPISIVYGIQLGLGLSLATKGVAGVTQKGWWVWDGRLTAILVAFALALSTYHFPKFPTALVFVLMGFVAAVYDMHGNVPEYALVTPASLVVTEYNLDDFVYTLWAAALPQIPVTAMNSVVSVCHLGHSLFGVRNSPSTTEVATAVGVMNLLSCPLGGMPMCHGAGGLAAQYRFGARGGFSIFCLGCAKILFALLFGSYAKSVLVHFPTSVLNVLLVVSGLQLASCAKSMGSEDDAFVTLLTAAVSISTNVAYGTVAGAVLVLVMSVRRRSVVGETPGV